MAGDLVTDKGAAARRVPDRNKPEFPGGRLTGREDMPSSDGRHLRTGTRHTEAHRQQWPKDRTLGTVPTERPAREEEGRPGWEDRSRKRGGQASERTAQRPTSSAQS